MAEMSVQTLGIIKTACALDETLSLAAREAFFHPMLENSAESWPKKFLSSSNRSPLIARIEESLEADLLYEKHFCSVSAIERPFIKRSILNARS